MSKKIYVVTMENDEMDAIEIGYASSQKIADKMIEKVSSTDGFEFNTYNSYQATIDYMEINDVPVCFNEETQLKTGSFSALTQAIYVTEWDNGETVLESPCEVNLLSHEIVSIKERSIIISPYNEDVLDDCIVQLDKEYIRFPDGTCSDVIDNVTNWSFDEKGGMIPFYRGKFC